MAFQMVPLAGWVAIGAIVAQRFLSGWKRRRLAGAGSEIKELRARVAQLETLSTAGSVAEVLGAASAAWRVELKKIVDNGSFLLAKLPQGLRQTREAREFEAALRAASGDLAALDMLAGAMRFEVQQEAQLADAVRRAVERTHDIFERLGLTVEFDIEEGGVPCAFDMELLTSALVNVLINAAEASGTGAKITVRAISDFRGERGVIEIIDRGSGINSDVMPYIFKPFFTTKPDHLGLGLAVAREIVARMGGSIAVAANETRGVTFRVRMPMKRAELVGQTADLARARKAAASGEEPVIPQEKILHHIKR
ncbi:MAG: sensor histidine kinase, partial [Planctomycetes bacterium]|nr:sensor histidine kinase [Planctomycetota bacterium]